MAEKYTYSEVVFGVFTTSKGELNRFLDSFYINASLLSIRFRFVCLSIEKIMFLFRVVCVTDSLCFFVEVDLLSYFVSYAFNVGYISI